MAEVMIDIETLSTEKNAAIISIGVAAFTMQEGVIDSEGYYLDMKHVHGHIDPATVRWWMGQSESAREVSFGGRHTPYAAALALCAFFERHKPSAVWANSPTFDSVILGNWWKGVTHGPLPAFPIPYKLERDVRTIRALAKELGIPETEWAGVAHNPVDDCCNQARDVIGIRKEIQRRIYGEHG